MIQYNGEIFVKVNEFDCICLDLDNEFGGGMFTCFPISDLEYRKDHPTKAKVKIDKTDSQTIFNIFSDWGTLYQVIIDNIHQQEIEYAIQKAKEYELLN
jgi:hypothetical protein